MIIGDHGGSPGADPGFLPGEGAKGIMTLYGMGMSMAGETGRGDREGPFFGVAPGRHKFHFLGGTRGTND